MTTLGDTPRFPHYRGLYEESGGYFLDEPIRDLLYRSTLSNNSYIYSSPSLRKEEMFEALILPLNDKGGQSYPLGGMGGTLS